MPARVRMAQTKPLRRGEDLARLHRLVARIRPWCRGLNSPVISNDRDRQKRCTRLNGIREVPTRGFGQVGHHARIETRGILGLERGQSVPLGPVGPAVHERETPQGQKAEPDDRENDDDDLHDCFPTPVSIRTSAPLHPIRDNPIQRITRTPRKVRGSLANGTYAGRRRER